MASIINASTSGAGGVITTADASGQLELQTAGATAITVDASQNVGIGTSSPTYKLDIRSTGGSLPVTPDGIRVNLSGYTSDVYSVRLFTGADSGGVPYSQLMGPKDPNGWLAFTMGSSDQERMRITATGDLRFNSGYGSAATAYGCRAWVNFNGTGTVAIRASGNVTSITDSGVGTYEVNFTTAMPDANYCGVVTSDSSGNYYIGSVNSAAYTTSSMGLRALNQAGSAVDSPMINVAIFR
jgi:hypothetical protein